jgi:hypothetical protein
MHTVNWNPIPKARCLCFPVFSPQATLADQEVYSLVALTGARGVGKTTIARYVECMGLTNHETLFSIPSVSRHQIRCLLYPASSRNGCQRHRSRHSAAAGIEVLDTSCLSVADCVDIVVRQFSAKPA